MGRGVRPIADRHFERLGAYVGIDMMVITYRNRRGGLCNEVLTFYGPLVIERHSTYREPAPYHAAG